MGGRIALVSNCLANQNAKVAEYEVCPGGMVPLLQLLRARGFAVIQMPCPEMTFLGCGRWWQVRAQYDTAGYRRHCRMAAGTVADALSQAGGCTDLVLLGVDGSPSSGVQVTDSGADWGGRPGPREVALVPGQGVWIEVLLQVLAERGLGRPRLIGIGSELPGYDPEAELARLDRFLQGAVATLPEIGEAPPPAAVRGRAVLVVPQEGFADPDVLALAADWGLLQLPGPEAGAALELLADQVEDYRRHGYRVAGLPGPGLAQLNAELARRGGAPLSAPGPGPRG